MKVSTPDQLAGCWWEGWSNFTVSWLPGKRKCKVPHPLLSHILVAQWVVTYLVS